MRYEHGGRLYGLPEWEAKTPEERLERLESLRAIEECLFYYTKSADRADPVGMAACFTEGAVLRWDPQKPPVACGRDAILEHFRTIIGRAKTQEHFCSSFQIRFLSASGAIGECNMCSWQIWKDADKPETVCYGRYEFEAAREEGEWRLRSLCLTLNGKMEGTRLTERFAEQNERPWPPEPLS